MINCLIGTIVDTVRKCFIVINVPQNINCDREFNIKLFNQLMKEENVKIWFSDPNEINKNAIVERFNHTLAMLIQK